MGHHVGSKKGKQKKQNSLISPLSAILCNDIIACWITISGRVFCWSLCETNYRKDDNQVSLIYQQRYLDMLMVLLMLDKTLSDHNFLSLMQDFKKELIGSYGIYFFVPGADKCKSVPWLQMITKNCGLYPVIKVRQVKFFSFTLLTSVRTQSGSEL